MAPPYNLPSNVSTVLAQICCFSNKLPQGAPTSPIVSNMVCARLDSQLRLLAKDSNCTYTRYADDITFSTSLPKLSRKIAYKSPEHDEVFVGEQLLSIIRKNGFEVNWKKVRLQHKNYHQEVTGLTVNEFPNVDRKFVRQISSMLHVWDKFGLVSAQMGYVQRQIEKLELSDEEVAEKQFPPFQEVLRGKINFLKMVKGKDDVIYQKYLNWYRKLSKRS